MSEAGTEGQGLNEEGYNYFIIHKTSDFILMYFVNNGTNWDLFCKL